MGTRGAGGGGWRPSAGRTRPASRSARPAPPHRSERPSPTRQARAVSGGTRRSTRIGLLRHNGNGAGRRVDREIGVPTGTVSPGSTSSPITCPRTARATRPRPWPSRLHQRPGSPSRRRPARPATRGSRPPSAPRRGPGAGTRGVRLPGSPGSVRSPVDGVEHPVQVGQVVVLAARGRVGRVEAGHPQHRGLQRVEALLGTRAATSAATETSDGASATTTAARCGAPSRTPGPGPAATACAGRSPRGLAVLLGRGRGVQAGAHHRPVAGQRRRRRRRAPPAS